MKVFLLIGVGGTGGSLAWKLAKMLKKEDFMFLIDGDKIEHKNIFRQPYQPHDIGEFKSIALARKINSITEFKNVYAINKYIADNQAFCKLIKKSFISKNSDFKLRSDNKTEFYIVSCVDNHKTRLILEESYYNLFSFINDIYNHDYYFMNKPKTFYIDSANEENYGDIIFNELRSKIYDLKIEDSKQLVLSETSCEELISDGLIQQFTTNDQASNLILQIIQDDKIKNQKGQIFFQGFNSKIKIFKDDKESNTKIN